MTLGRILVVLLLATSLFAQEPAAAPPDSGDAMPVFRSETEEVIVPVTVTDEQGRFVSDLTKDDFTVFDQDVQQKITYFNADRSQPIVIGFLIEQSNTMRLHWDRFQEAAIELVLALMPEDSRFNAYLIGYHTQAELLVNTTNESGKLVDAITNMKPGGGSALFDAIYMACESREIIGGEPIEPRRVLVIIGDGHDNASSKTMGEVLELAQRDLVTIYSMSTVPFEDRGDSEGNLVKLAEQTGGRIVYPLDDIYDSVEAHISNPQEAGNYALTVGTGGYGALISKNIFTAVSDIVGEVTTQYILRYTPTAIDNPRQFRRIQVTVSLPGVHVNTRPGYYPYQP